jgi:SAM-dependent methyltransferase
MASASVYGPEFFAHQTPGSEQSARHLLPLALRLIRPQSIVDVGCGSGVWLAHAAELGVGDHLGVDGHTPASALRIEPDRFLLHDLTTPLRLDRRYDLVLCLEVAEHLPEKAADVLVDSLVGLGPAVVFSAAIPGQSGEHHVNEQWPDYWSDRFAARGLVAVDAFRPRVWSEPSVDWWYRQNVLLFCEPGLVEGDASLAEARAATRDGQLSVVHPDLYTWKSHDVARLEHERTSLEHEVERLRSLRGALGAARSALARRLSRR